MAATAQSLPVRGVKDERKQLRDLPLMVRLFSRTAASFTAPVGLFEHRGRPSLPARIGGKSLANDVDDALRAVTFPVGVISPTKVLAHPFALAGRGAEVVLRGVSYASRGPANCLSALVTRNGDDLITGAPPSHPARIATELTPSSARPYTNGLLALKAVGRIWLQFSDALVNAVTAFAGTVELPALGLKRNTAAPAGVHE